MNEKSVFHLYYYEGENIFKDEKNTIIYNPFKVITPQDLFLFRHDYGINLFPMRNNPSRLCEIILIPDEICGLQDMFDMDIGDDYERIERYEETKLSGHLI